MSLGTSMKEFMILREEILLGLEICPIEILSIDIKKVLVQLRERHQQEFDDDPREDTVCFFAVSRMVPINKNKGAG
jgi:hypothetical protein